MNNKPELYVSIDVETDGPVPGLNSMLSLGAVLFRGEDDAQIDHWYRKFRPLAQAVQNKETMEWWKTQPEGWEEVQKDKQTTLSATWSFVQWLDEYSKESNLVGVAWPAAFDFAFVNYYCHSYAGCNPLGYACIDIRSYVDGVMRQPSYYSIREAELLTIVGEVDKTDLRPHIALDDAIGQGRLFMKVRRHVINSNKEQEEILGRSRKVQGDA